MYLWIWCENINNDIYNRNLIIYTLYTLYTLSYYTLLYSILVMSIEENINVIMYLYNDQYNISAD